MKRIYYVTLFLCFLSIACIGQDIHIKIERLAIKNGLITGKIYANDKYLGPAYENEMLKIAAGTYKGLLRYYSNKNFVTSALGKLAKEGDFLLEVGNVNNREGLLFHTGNKPYHARGCVLLGVPTVSDDKKFLPQDNPIRQLRTLFYGQENPISSPNKKITITIDETKLKSQNDSVNSSLLIIIDVSGSMNGDKLTQAKASAKEAVQKALKNKSTEVAIIAFEGNCENPIHTALGFSTNEKYLIETINRMETGNGTPLASAIERANEYMANNKSQASITQMIILLADGDDDCGNLDAVLTALAKQEIVFRHETIGLGLERNLTAQNQLKSIAEKTKGNYHNSSSSSELSKQFSDALENMKMLEMMGKITEPKKVESTEKKNNSDINWNILKE